MLVRERVNARALTQADIPFAVGLVTIDVSFISLGHILPGLLRFLLPDADVVALVKPQFEAGRHQVPRGGVVTDPAVQLSAVERVLGAALAAGFRHVTTTESSLPGARGNREFFVHLKPR